MKPLAAMTPVEKTKALFLTAWSELYPVLRPRDGERAWRDLRTRVELEEIRDLTNAMGRTAVSVMRRRESNGAQQR